MFVVTECWGFTCCSTTLNHVNHFLLENQHGYPKNQNLHQDLCEGVITAGMDPLNVIYQV